MTKLGFHLCKKRGVIHAGFIPFVGFILLVGLCSVALSYGAGALVKDYLTMTMVSGGALLLLLVHWAVIKFREFQFSWQFNCYPPGPKQSTARAALLTHVQDRLTELAAQYDAADYLKTWLNSSALQSVQKNTVTSRSRTSLYDTLATTVHFEKEKRQMRFNNVRNLATAFEFQVDDLELTLKHIHTLEQTQAALESVATAPAS